jgi:hypothetical protein
MGTKDAKRPDTSFKLSREHVERAREISEFASRQGWSTLGVDRGDPPTIKAVVEAAIDALHARMSQRRSR